MNFKKEACFHRRQPLRTMSRDKWRLMHRIELIAVHLSTLRQVFTCEVLSLRISIHDNKEVQSSREVKTLSISLRKGNQSLL